MSELILSLAGVSKHFKGVHALKGVDLTLSSGEVRALVGANGSGKSTLVKILAGYHQPEPGAIMRLRGEAAEFAAISKAQQRLGIGIVHQDLGLIEELSVLENFLLPTFATSLSWFVNWSALSEEAARFLKRFSVGGLNTNVRSVPRVTRALLALARAVRNLESLEGGAAEANAKGILVLDEITAFLSAEEVQLLHEVVRGSAESGHAVLFISHDLGEVMSFADTVTVLRDGAVVGHRKVEDTNLEDLFEMIVGQRREEAVPVIATKPDVPHAVRVSGAGIAGAGQSSFEVAPGEVVGLSGLLGSGFEEIPYILFGARGDGVGRLYMTGEEISLRTLQIPQAMAHGVALVPADRRASGLIEFMSITENITMLQLRRFAKRGFLAWRELGGFALSLIHRYKIVARSPGDNILTLSGGNQQRVLLAKWLETKSKLLLLHEPVQGVDVAARIEIIRLIRTHAKEGAAIICASSDYELLSEVADRVLIYRDGTIVDELTKDPVSQSISRQEIEWACLSKGATTVVIEPEYGQAAEN